VTFLVGATESILGTGTSEENTEEHNTERTSVALALPLTPLLTGAVASSGPHGTVAREVAACCRRNTHGALLQSERKVRAFGTIAGDGDRKAFRRLQFLAPPRLEHLSRHGHIGPNVCPAMLPVIMYMYVCVHGRAHKLHVSHLLSGTAGLSQPRFSSSIFILDFHVAIWIALGKATGERKEGPCHVMDRPRFSRASIFKFPFGMPLIMGYGHSDLAHRP